MIKRYILTIGLVMCVASVASSQNLPLVSGQKLTPQQQQCTGAAVVDLPTEEACPDKPGYVVSSFVACTQASEVPRKLTFKEIAPGFGELVCVLDYAHADPIGTPECDDSRCIYIAAPL